MDKIKILLINDNDEQSIIINELINEISDNNYVLIQNKEKTDLNKILLDNKYDVYIIDNNFIDKKNIDIRDDVIVFGNYYSFIILTSNNNIKKDLKFLKLGNCDFLNINTINSEILEKTIRYSIDKKMFILEREILLDMINEKNEEVQDLIYTISHDIRSPLLNIKGFSQEFLISNDNIIKILSNKYDITKNNEIIEIKKNIKNSIKYINLGVDKIENILNGLLIVSRLETRNIDLNQINFIDLIKDVIKNLKSQISNKNIKININKNIPDCIGDEILLKQVFTNLINNAIKYLDPNRKGIISISGYIKKDSNYYVVEDNGIGIEEINFKSIFKIFHKININEKIKGEGLGLSIVKKIINKHNGKVWVESKVGKGSKFYISIPNYLS